MTGVRVNRDRAVTVVTIDRPERRNAVDAPTAAALRAALVAFDEDDASAVAVLTGAGGTFCAGADLKALAEGEARPVDGAHGPMGPTRMRLSKPAIAAVEGHAVGGGLELALWCDLRVAGRGAVFGVFNRRFGVPLVDGGTVALPRLIGRSRALDLILTGRAVDAEEALAIGLVNRLVAPGTALSAAISLAGELAAVPQSGLRNDRLSTLEQEGLDVDAALANEARRGAATVASGESVRGAARFAAPSGGLRPGLRDAARGRRATPGVRPDLGPAPGSEV
jgi:enoyl-CoA hydratase